MPSFYNEFNTNNPASKSLIGTTLIVGSIAGSFPAGPVTHKYGRRPALMLTAFLYASSCILAILANSAMVVVAARFVGGLGYGFANMVCSMYTAEIAPVSQRGLLVSLFQIFIAFGIFTANLANDLFLESGKWTGPLVVALLPALAMLVLVYAFVPESPVWLNSRANDAADTDDASTETESIGQLFADPLSRKRILLGSFIAGSQQVCGVNAVLFFGPALVADVLNMTDSAGPFHAAVAVGAVFFMGTLSSLLVVERFGRRTLFLGAAVPMLISLLTLGGMRMSIIPVNNLVGVSMIFLFMATFAITYGPLPFLVCAEIFPVRYKGVGMAISSGSMLLVSLFVAATFLPLLSVIGGAVYVLYAFGVTLSTLLIWKYLPETKDLSLDEIQNRLDGISEELPERQPLLV